MTLHPQPENHHGPHPLRAWLHQGTTILGIAACGSALSSWLLDQVTIKQAAAIAIGGIISIAMKQVTGTTVVTGAQPVVQAETANVAAPMGSKTTITSGSAS